MTRWARLGRLAVLAGLLALPATARAKATLMMFEGSAGASSSVYGNALPGWAVGLSLGPTVKHSDSSVRYHILGNLQAHRTPSASNLDIDRTDLAAFVSVRTVFPVKFPLRLYLEGGLGTRYAYRSVPGLDPVTSFEPLLVVAAGAQLRWAEELSLGLRGALEPLEPLETFVDRGQLNGTRGSLTLTVGYHF